MLLLCSCSAQNDVGKTNIDDETIQPESKSSGKIFLYGETHGVKQILNREIEIWKGYYEEGMRDLFIEIPYYTAQYLNLWMKAEDDAILDALYQDWKGSAMHSEEILTFYKTLKYQCPGTRFYGTDVGHHYESTGERYLKELQEQNLQESEEYQKTLEAIEQLILP